MLSFKPEMDMNSAMEFLENVLGGPVSNVLAINEGELSRVFSFVHKGRDLIVHFNTQGDHYRIEQIVYNALSVHDIRIPRPVRIDRVGDIHYSVVEKVPGKSIASFPDDTIRTVLPHLVKEFKKITDVSVEGSGGYGWILPSGNGAFGSWAEYVRSFFGEKQSGFWEGWYSLFENSFLERDVFERYHDTMIELAKSSPEKRYIVHGDFHLWNMLSDGCVVTGIVDWGMVMYGDFMFDVATQHFWRPDLGFPGLVQATWKQDGRSIPNFDERLKCGLIFKGLDGLRFFAKKGDPGAYDWVKNRLFELS